MSKVNLKKLFIWSACLLGAGAILFLFWTEVAGAQGLDVGLTQVGEGIGLPATDIRLIIARIVRAALGLLGIVAVVLMIYAGYLWMTAGGDEKNVDRAKTMMINAAIGLAIMLSAYAIVSFVMSKLLEATNNLPPHCFNRSQDLEFDETGVDCGGECESCINDNGNPYLPGGSSFFVDTLPLGGEVCIKNYYPAIMFNRPPDLSTLDNKIVVEKASGGAASGNWTLGASDNIAVFKPSGSCAPETGEDCLEANTDYVLKFVAGQFPFILSLDVPPLSLVGCRASDRSVNVANCHDVAFKTGSGVDRNPPEINFIFPDSASALSQGETVPVSISYVDDNGVQSISLRADNNYVGSAAFTGCNKNGSAIINWPTASISAGDHALLAAGTDFAGLSDTANVTVNLRPQQCFNGIRDGNEDAPGDCCAPAKSCGCGACPGSSCAVDSQCRSGYCDTASGTCLDRLQIRSVTPMSGAPGSYVSIGGLYFGNDPGRVYFPKVVNPNKDTASDWLAAPLVACGLSFDNWTPQQILAEVPDGAKSGPLLVEHKDWTTAPAERKFIFKDATDDAPGEQWGPLLPPFTVDSLVRPGICGVVPASGVVGADVEVYGKNFGTSLTAGTDDNVYFGGRKAVISDWSDVLVNATVPSLSAGAVGLKITDNGVESNSVRFDILSGTEENIPIISDISPRTGAKGEYITISGKNFGWSRGNVWFKRQVSSDSLPTNDIFSFPAECGNAVWSDTKIIVKFPNAGTAGDSYFIQVNTSQNKASLPDNNMKFTLAAGSPRPGLCKIDPSSAPVPYPDASPLMRLVGEYFGSDINNIRAYFWANGASIDTVTGRLIAPPASYILSKTADNKGDVLSLRPPESAETGPVVAGRQGDGKISNPLAFTVLDCRTNNNKCSLDTEHCCPDGACKAAGDMCAGVVRSTGYVWRFSSKDIPDAPHVVERCIDSAANFPTPSPSVQWDVSSTGDHHQVCREAAITVEFSLSGINNIPRANFIVNECQAGDVGAVDVDKRNCVSAQEVLLSGQGDFDPQPSSPGSDSLELYPAASYNGGKWKDNTWYQVVLGGGITVGSGQDTARLVKDRPCSVLNSAYCFLFRTDAQDCRMKSVVVLPYSYHTSVLESPMKHRSSPTDAGTDLYYRGLGLSDQRCIIMNTNLFGWAWTTGDINFASIFGGASGNSAQISSLANTVGIGRTNPDDAVNINARASNGGLSFDGASPLTIDLSKPEVVDYWPKCLEACIDASVGARFNTSMSGRNLPGVPENGSVQLLKCNDENCLDTSSVLNVDDVDFVDPMVDPSYTILNIANSRMSSLKLEPDTLYKVVLSATTNVLTSPKLLWSMARSSDHASYAKPLDKEFSWRFRTKKERCVVDRVEVTPKVFNARVLTSRAIYGATPYSSPDTCSREGQMLNPWSIGWSWSSSDVLVAITQNFKTLGQNSNCTSKCIRKGSYISRLNTSYPPICGNGKLEAGEDCDSPNKTAGCGLNCVLINRVNQGSSSVASSTNIDASICGNGLIGVGEDCDLGIPASVNVQTSAMNCSANCLHAGSPLSRLWCENNRTGRQGFTEAEYGAACGRAISRCGDGVDDPAEDPGCDVTPFNENVCTEFCLLKTGDYAGDISNGNGCGLLLINPAEGCDGHLRHNGSSLGYTVPSSCGDGIVGTGEDAYCENRFTAVNPIATGENPWTLAKGVGRGTATGDPPAQRSDITAATIVGSVARSGSGRFSISCGYETDEECEASRTAEQIAAGINLGVGSDSCCYEKPRLIPPAVPAFDASNVCPNTYISATFSGELNPASVIGNVLLAKGENATGASCAEGTTPVSGILLGAAEGEHWYKRIFIRLVDLARGLFGREASAGVVTAWCSGGESFTTSVVYDEALDRTKIIIKLSEPLATSTAGVDYAVVLKDGIKNKKGVSIGREAGHDIFWRFLTGQELCAINLVTVTPSQYFFSRAGEEVTLTAGAFAEGNRQIQSLDGVYAWNYLWTPADNPYVTLSDTTAENNLVTAQNRNGELDAVAAANVTANIANPSQTGPAGSGKSRLAVFLCENPWPPKDLSIDGSPTGIVIWPWEDKLGNNDHYDLSLGRFDGAEEARGGVYNYSTFYCADNGGSGTVDDLPYLRVAVQAGVEGTDKFLKRIIFTDRALATSDAIGIQIFSNPNHLTAREWYEADKTAGGQGFIGEIRNIKVDGYDAVTDGNNYYVDALNISDGSPRNIYSNIYLFSINADARPEMRKVFEQMLSNISFNINLTNSYCKAVGSQETTLSCSKDSDCPPATPICTAQISKLKRNYARLRGLATIADSLDVYSARNGGILPDLEQGSYLSGQTISTWPSWSALGSAVGRALPVDPINQLGKAGTCKNDVRTFCVDDSVCAAARAGDTCVLHDPVTGWSDVDRRFLFACNTDSYAYRYIFKENLGNGAENFEVRARTESIFDNVPNSTAISGSGSAGSWNNFVKGFLGDDYLTRFEIDNTPNNICLNAPEISGQAAGRCGDRIINPGEECDPPGAQNFGACGAVTANKVKVAACSPRCLWAPSSTTWIPGNTTDGYVPCSFLSKCGNGIVETGEDCDAGSANGKAGSGCSALCAVVNTCGNNVRDNNELCDWSEAIGLPNPDSLRVIDNVRYSLRRENSCNFDCQSYGPYCGDGTVQTDFGESCEGDEDCKIGNVSGKRICSNTCHAQVPSSVVGFWKFDDVNNMEKDYSSFGHAGSCVGSCPDWDDGKIGGAAQFNSSDRSPIANYISVNPSADFVLTVLTIEAWVRIPPSATLHEKHTILSKTDNFTDTDYALHLISQSQDRMDSILFESRQGSTAIFGSAAVNVSYGPEEWHHIVVTMGANYTNTSRDNIKFYSDGIRLNNVNVSQPGVSSANANHSYSLRIGAGWSGGLIDELVLYNRALSDAEIQDRYQNYLKGFCDTSAGGGNPPESVAGGCGDGVVQSTEACDLGSSNGLICTPSYNRPCTYCSADCKNKIEVTPTAYCGNGVIDVIRPGTPNVTEVCDFTNSGADSPQGVIVGPGGPITTCAADSAGLRNSSYLGYKECADNCTRIASHCVACGLDPGGVTVAGDIVNVLNMVPGSPLYSNPLDNGGKLELRFTSPGVGIVAGRWNNSASPKNNFTLLKPNPSDPSGPPLSEVAKIGSDPMCSASTYSMRVNDRANNLDWFSFPISKQPSPGQYDLVVSPVIQNKHTYYYQGHTTSTYDHSNDIRVVARWEGDGDFISGFFAPLDTGAFSVEGVNIMPTEGNVSTNTEAYYKLENCTHKGVWWHGNRLDSAADTKAEAFTIYTESSEDSIGRGRTDFEIDLPTICKPRMKYDQYAFYVRSLTPISKYLNTAKLRVEVYLPKDYSNAPAGAFEKIFIRPDKVFEFKKTGGEEDVVSSENPGAAYWQVFNIIRSDKVSDLARRVEPVMVVASSLSSRDISPFVEAVTAAEPTVALPNGIILSGPNQFKPASVGQCQPTCSGRVCGSDGCGGTCGACVSPATCNETSGQCVANCSSVCNNGEKQCVAQGLKTCGDYNGDTCYEWSDPPQNCADTDTCTDDSCSTVSGCQHTNIAGCVRCDNASQCNDSNPCTSDTCTGVGGRCQHSNVTNNTSCDNTTRCDGLETCQSGVCVAGTALYCNDYNSCTTDSCSPTAGCQNAVISGCQSCTSNLQCDDLNPCNGTETCNLTTQQCQSGAAPTPTCAARSSATCGYTITPSPNCGTCPSGAACLVGSGKTCNGTTCVCPSGQTDCSGVCKNLSGTVCSDGNSCTAGETYHDACGTPSSCYGGTAVAADCPTGAALTSALLAEICGTPLVSPNGCGVCGVGSYCAAGTGSCVSGSCVLPTCTSWTYSAWGACVGGVQTRSVLSSSPADCIGGSPITSQSCIVTCTSWDYSAWGACVGGNQTRTVTASYPSGCAGGSPITSQTCTCTPGATNPTNPCSVCKSDGSGWIGGNAGASCRTSAGTCDKAETCDGVNTNCPTDTFQSNATVCRASVDTCDKAEYCIGSSAVCPSDTFKASGTTCRASAGVCDLAETCNGSSASCPADAKSTGSCRNMVSICDVTEKCDGINNACPADQYQSAGYVCRDAVPGGCDYAERCTGVFPYCPPDFYMSAGYVCRASADVCDKEEICDGVNANCPADTFQSNATVCRATAGVCDVTENCTGSSAACPADAKRTTACRAAAGTCDKTEWCNGVSDACPVDSYNPSGTVCRAAVGVCDKTETCNGSSASCPADAYVTAGTTCRASSGVCDMAEVCSGSSTACPSDAKRDSTYICRPIVNGCDIAETCNGTSNLCPLDVFKPVGGTCICSSISGPYCESTGTTPPMACTGCF